MKVNGWITVPGILGMVIALAVLAPLLFARG